MFQFFRCYSVVNLKDWPLVLIHDLAGKNHANSFIEKFFHDNKWKYMYLNVGIELVFCEGNRHDFSRSLSNPKLLWNYSRSLNDPKSTFALYPFSLNWDKDFNLICLIFLHSFIFICSAIIMPAWAQPVNQLISITDFDSHFMSFSASLKFANI